MATQCRGVVQRWKPLSQQGKLPHVGVFDQENALYAHFLCFLHLMGFLDVIIHYLDEFVVFLYKKGPDLLTGASPSLAQEAGHKPESAIPGKLTPQNSLAG